MKITVTDRIEPGEYELSPLAAPVPEPEPEDPPPDPPPEPEPEPPLPPPPPPPVEAVTEVWKDEIGWMFASPTVVGRYVNGDYWCLPTVVQSVYPGWSGGRGGSMVNPSYFGEASKGRGPGHGFDSILPRFTESLRAQFPLALTPGKSLVTTSSWRLGESGAPAATSSLPNAPRPTIRHAAVLTCVSEPPLAGAFRPTYAGTEKIHFSTGDLVDVAALPRWSLPSDAPSVASVVSQTERLWLNIREAWHARYMRPDHNMKDYGRDSSAVLGDAMLLLLCNIPNADKLRLAINIAQIAIDQYGVFGTGYVSGRDKGAISVGWHGAVVIGGYLLRDDEMRDYFIGKPLKTTLEMAQVARDEQGLYWREDDTMNRAENGSDTYRKLSTPAWMPHLMAVRALGLELSWGHADSFEFQDAYQQETLTYWYHYAIHPWHRTLWLDTEGGRHAP